MESDRRAPESPMRSISEAVVEHVNHPAHYGGDTTYEAIKVMLAWHGYDAVIAFCLLNAEKYISRLGKKNETANRDLEKSIWYMKYALRLRQEMETNMSGMMKFYDFTLYPRDDASKGSVVVTVLGEADWHALKRLRESYPEAKWAIKPPRV